MSDVFTTSFETLPETLPLLPMESAILVPGGQVPLTFYDDDMMGMVWDCLREKRMIGFVHVLEEEHTSHLGCAGRINAFCETDDGAVMVSIVGVIRFHVREIFQTKRGYDRVWADYQSFEKDMDQHHQNEEADVNVDGFYQSLRHYLQAGDIPHDWQTMEHTPIPQIITTLSMGCPMNVDDKHALIHANTLTDRVRIFTNVMENVASRMISGSMMLH